MKISNKLYLLFILITFSCSTIKKGCIKGTFVMKGPKPAENKYYFTFKNNGKFYYSERIPARKQKYKGYGYYKNLSNDQIALSFNPFAKLEIYADEIFDNKLSKDSISMLFNFINLKYSKTYGVSVYFININGYTHEIRLPETKRLTISKGLQSSTIRIYTLNDGNYFSMPIHLKKETNMVTLKIELPKSYVRYCIPFGGIEDLEDEILKSQENKFDDVENAVAFDTLVIKNEKEFYYKKYPRYTFHKNGWFRKSIHRAL